MNVGAIEAFAEGCVEAVAFGQPIVERACFTLIRLATWLVARHEIGGRRAAMGAVAYIVDTFALCEEAHVGMVVGQPEATARPDHGKRVGGIEAKEVDPRLGDGSICPQRRRRLDIGAHVEFGEGGESWYVWEAARRNVGHAKGDNANPSHALIGVQFKLWRDEAAHDFRRDRPMGKEQVHPRLAHQPRRIGQRPKAMVSMLAQLGKCHGFIIA